MSGPGPLGDDELKTAIAGLPARAAPPIVESPGPGIGLTGCGAISELHLAAYQRLELSVSALCSRDVSKAADRAQEFCPNAAVFGSHAELLQHPGVGVVDIATHPKGRAELVAAALQAGKHVLCQKPFALSVAEGRALIDLAEGSQLTLAVNQNGRWAPHLAAIREAVHAGVIGVVEDVAISISWDHSWTVGTAFDRTPHLVLFDFGIHWFDFIVSLIGERDLHEVRASASFSPGQSSPQPMLASVVMLGSGLRVTVTFDGNNQGNPWDETRVSGPGGTLWSKGPDLHTQELCVLRGDEVHGVPLSGDWFTTGFEGSMSELISASRGRREPLHGARENLRSLELAFAACASANAGEPVRPGDALAFPGEG